MGCGASSAAETKYVEPPSSGDGGEDLPIEEIDGGIAHVQPPTLDEDPLHDMRPDDPANGSQWDQLAPLLPKVALRQVAKASVTTDTIWSGTSPAAVLVIRLPGFTKMCDEWAAGNDTMPLSRLLNSLYAKLVACARRRGGDLVHFLGEVCVFAFTNDSSAGGEGKASGKEDEVRGEADGQCFAACRCALEFDECVTKWAAARSLHLSSHTAVATGDLKWTHLEATVGGSNRQLGQSRRSVLCHGPAIQEALGLANKAAVAAMDDGADWNETTTGIVSADAYEPIRDKFEFRSPNVDENGLMQMMSPTNTLAFHLPFGVQRVITLMPLTTPDEDISTPGTFDTPSPEWCGIDRPRTEAHPLLLPYLTTSRQRAATPAENRPLLVMAVHLPAEPTGEQLSLVFRVLSESLDRANGVLLHLLSVQPRPRSFKQGPIKQGEGGPTVGLCALAVFGLAAAELDDARATRCALSIAEKLGSLSTNPVQASIALHRGVFWLPRLGQPYRHQSLLAGRDLDAVMHLAEHAEQQAVIVTHAVYAQLSTSDFTFDGGCNFWPPSTSATLAPSDNPFHNYYAANNIGEVWRVSASGSE